MTWIELARSHAKAHKKDLTDETLEFILWEYTAFPLASPEFVGVQLCEFFACCQTS